MSNSPNSLVCPHIFQMLFHITVNSLDRNVFCILELVIMGLPVCNQLADELVFTRDVGMLFTPTVAAQQRADTGFKHVFERMVRECFRGGSAVQDFGYE